MEIDNGRLCILYNVTKIIYRLDFLTDTAYHEINVHVHVKEWQSVGKPAERTMAQFGEAAKRAVAATQNRLGGLTCCT